MVRLLLLVSGLLTLPGAQGERGTAEETPSSQVRCWTTQGRFTIDLYKKWAPLSVKRFTALVNDGYYDDQVVFRKLPGLMLAQFGHHFDMQIRHKAQEKPLQSQQSSGVPFRKGTISFASAQDSVVFIADEGKLAEQMLDGSEAYHRPFGVVSEGLDVLERFHHYPEGSFQSNYTHDAEAFIHHGKDGIENHWPHLDILVACRLQGSAQYDDSHAQSISSAVDRRKQVIAVFENPERQAYYHRPSAETVPDEFVETCRQCVKKVFTVDGTEGQGVFCLSTLACAEAYQCMSPKDEVQEKAKCTKSEIHRRWPATFSFPNETAAEGTKMEEGEITTTTTTTTDPVTGASDQARCWTTQGRFTIDLHRAWAPKSTKRFVKLVKQRYYDDQVVFRKIPGLMLAQFGHHFDMKTRRKAQEKPLKPQKNAGVEFVPGIVSFASAQDTVVFVADEGNLVETTLTGEPDYQRPFGFVVQGLDTLAKLYHYPEGSFQSNYTHDAEAFVHDGKDGIRNHWPHLDFIVACRMRGSDQYEDQAHAESVQAAMASRSQGVAQYDAPERRAFYAHPSADTIPDEFVTRCNGCVKTVFTSEGEEGKQVFCVSTLACAAGYTCMSPKDEVQDKKHCTKAELFRRWPATFTFPETDANAQASDKDEL